MSNSFLKIFIIDCCLVWGLVGSSCKKLVEVDSPVTNPTEETAYKSNSTATAVLTGIYIRMIQGSAMSSGTESISFLSGLSADELNNYSTIPVFGQFYKNAVNKSNIPFWSESYRYIYTANAALEGLSSSNTITPEVKQQLMGEAYFIRAFFYFYLVNLFGDVPLQLTTDYKETSSASRKPKADVYKQIIGDLKQAQSLLRDDYLGADNKQTTERARPNKGAANALLARVYLYTRDFPNAEATSTLVINNTANYEIEPELDNVFLKNSREAIWQLAPVNPQYNTFDGYFFILTTAPGLIRPVALSPLVVSSMEEGDKRKEKWIGALTESGQNYYFPLKYKIGELDQPVSEYLMVLRIAEQYLIRAEARNELGDVGGAQGDLNIVRARAGLENTTASDKSSLIIAIEKERRSELFTEWGHRWLDLKRTGRVDQIMAIVTSQKGGIWNTNMQWYPVPINEIQSNPNITQNLGY